MAGENFKDEISALRTDHRLLAARVENVVGDLGDLRQDLDTKHKENRKSIHELRGNDQTIMDGLHRIELKVARLVGWCAGAGAATALLSKLIDHLLK